MTRENFVKGMTALGTAYGREIDEQTLGVYFAVVGKLSDADWESAVGRAMAKREFFPSPAVLLDCAERRSSDQVAATARQLEAMKTDPDKMPTLEQLKALRKEFGWP